MHVRSAGFAKALSSGRRPVSASGPMSTLMAVLTSGAMLALVSCSAPSTSKPKKVEERSFTLIALAELRGTIEPCGCNSDPLGDIARTAEIVASLRAQGKPVLVVDGGSLLYTQAKIPEHLMAQERLRSDLIYKIYQNDLKTAAVGLGPNDFGDGLQAIRPARQAANVDPASGVPIEAPKLVDVNGTQVGIFGVVAPDALSAVAVQASDPTSAAQNAVADLRARGAELVVALAYMLEPEAKRMARAVPGIDIMVVARNAPEPDKIKDAPARVGDTVVVAPANRGQIVTRLDITLRKGQDGPLSDAMGESRAAMELAKLAKDIEALQGKLSEWKADENADQGFVARKEQELAGLRQRRQSLTRSPLQIPDRGGFFTMTQIRINKGLPCHVEIQKAKQEFDKAAGAANVAAASGRKPPEPAEGQAGYEGIDACEECHEEQVAFWQKTKHQQAWETLDTLGKQFDYECIGCHVTGWERPGGANLAVNESLRDVQCEQCHGPASRHIDGDGDPEFITREPPIETCVQCHNKEHSDTFEYSAYLRDVTGDGHGHEYRQKLGDGPTGHELRSAALAGKVKGANCIK